jgi:hypothetical protein
MSQRWVSGFLVLALFVAGFALWKVQKAPVLDGGRRGTQAVLPTQEPAPVASDARIEEALPAERSALEEETAASVALAPTHLARGRVVDEHRYPVAGARVELCVPGVEAPAGTSGADGRFALEFAIAKLPGEGCSVRARDASGRAGFTYLWVGPAKEGELVEVDAGAVVLLEACTLRVRVRDGNAPSPGAEIRLALGHDRVFAGIARANAAGEALLDALPRGVVHIDATSGETTGHARAFVPEETETLIDLAPCLAVQVLVVDKESGAGIGGAELQVDSSYPVPMPLPGEESPAGLGNQEYWSLRPLPELARTTDSEGHATIEGLAPGQKYDLHVQAHGYCSNDDPVRIPPRDGSAGPVRVELVHATRIVSWPVVAGEVGVPPDGSVIELRHAPGSYARGDAPEPPPPGHMKGASLVGENIIGSSFLAEAPDGAVANIWVDDGSEIGNETSFRRPRTIEVLVHEASGKAAARAVAIARDQGNNDLCEGVAADGEGRAVLAGLYGKLADVYVGVAGEYPHQLAGSVDLTKGDGRVEATLATMAAVRLRVLLDGRPGLPAKFQVWGARLVEEFPDLGELSIALSVAHPGETMRFGVRAPGFLTASTELVPPTDGSVAQAQVELVRGAVLLARVELSDTERASILPQRFDEESKKFEAERKFGFQRMSQPNGPDSSFVYSGLTPGRWRVVDERSGAASTEAELFPGGGEARVELDLRSVTWVSGRVEVPDPAELARVVVLVGGVDAAPSGRSWLPGLAPPEGASAGDGSFRVRVPGDRTVTLVPWHPWLVPAADAGTCDVREGRDGVVLRLVEGDEVRLPVSHLAASPLVSSLRIGRYSGDAIGEPLEWRNAPVVDGGARFAVPHGTWTLWIDAGEGFAPLELHNVSVDGVTVLEPAVFERGSAVRVRVPVVPDQAAPRIFVSAMKVGAPAYFRSLNSDGENEVVLAGLGPGRFQLSLSTVMPFQAPTRREIELDGRSELVLDFDRP